MRKEKGGGTFKKPSAVQEREAAQKPLPKRRVIAAPKPAEGERPSKNIAKFKILANSMFAVRFYGTQELMLGKPEADLGVMGKVKWGILILTN